MLLQKQLKLYWLHKHIFVVIFAIVIANNIDVLCQKMNFKVDLVCVNKPTHAQGRDWHCTASLISKNNSPVADPEYKFLQIIYKMDVFINLKLWLGIWYRYEMTGDCNQF